MKAIILILIISFQFSFSQWNKIKSPVNLQSLSNFNVSEGRYYTFNGKELYKSEDEGDNWQEIQTNLKSFDSFGGVDEFKIFDGIFYIISKTSLTEKLYGLLYKSIDKGKTWEKIQLGDTRHLHFNKFDDDFFVSSDKNPKGLFRSKDALNWSKIDIGEDENSPFNYNKIFKTNDTLIVYQFGVDGTSGTANYNFIKISIDNGSSWIVKGNSLHSLGVKYIDKIGNTLVAGTRAGVYISEDFGDTWELRNGHLSKQQIYLNYLEVINGEIYIGSQLGFYKSVDTAKTWQSINIEFNGSYISYLNFIDGKFFVSQYNRITNTSYTFQSSDNFETTKVLNFRIPTFISSYINDDKEYIGTNGIYTFNNSTNDYELISDFFQNKYDAVYKMQKKENLIIAHIGGSIISKLNNTIISTDYGETWKIVDYQRDGVRIAGYYINEENRMFTITETSGILYSDDFGETWADLELDINTKTQLYTIKYTYKDGSIIEENDSIFIYLPSSILKTDKNFSEFEQIINRQDSTFMSNFLGKQIGIMKKYENFITLYNNDDKRLYFSYDYGYSWERCQFDFNLSNYALRDFFIYDILNIDSNLIVCTKYGIYLSLDWGQNWEEVSFNISDKMFGTAKYIFKDGKTVKLFANGFYELNLNELGIASVERRNALYHYPPYPQPSTTSVNIKTVWDSGFINFTEDDIEIYNLNGEKLITKDKIKINKEAQNIGTITWDNSGVEPGIYIMKTKHGTETLITKIMIIK